MAATSAMDRAKEALNRGRWSDALAAFQEAVLELDSVEAWDGVAVAARWSGDLPRAVAAREHAYRLRRTCHDDEGAAGEAAFLALDLLESTGATAVAAGWLARARDLLRDLPESPWLSAVDGIDGGLAGVYQRDFPRARRLLDSAAAGARSGGNLDAEMLANAQLGMILVLAGEVVEGMRLLDGATAAAMAGELTGGGNAVAVCCLLTAACLAIRDFDRAGQWSQYALNLADQHGGGTLFDYPRVDRAALLVWRGEWTQAEQDLREVIAGTTGWSRPCTLARLCLGDLQRRRGRFDNAMALLADLDRGPSVGGLEPLLFATQARLALDRGFPAPAAIWAERSLRSVGPDDIVVRADPLEVLARSRSALGQHEPARVAAAELAVLAATLGTAAIGGSALSASAAIAFASGELTAAGQLWERAGEFFRSANAPFETAVCDFEVARCLIGLEEPELAADRAKAAGRQLTELGADHWAGVVQRFLAGLPRATGDRPDLRLTPREVGVLILVANGRSNDEIAAQLFLSIRTVEQHVANIYAKIGVQGRAARAAATDFAHRNGLMRSAT